MDSDPFLKIIPLCCGFRSMKIISHIVDSDSFLKIVSLILCIKIHIWKSLPSCHGFRSMYKNHYPHVMDSVPFKIIFPHVRDSDPYMKITSLKSCVTGYICKYSESLECRTESSGPGSIPGTGKMWFAFFHLLHLAPTVNNPHMCIKLSSLNSHGS